MKHIIRVAAALFILAVCNGIGVAQELPRHRGYANDFAHLLSEDEVVKLEVELAKYDARTGIQIVVVTVKSLGGYSVEDYTRNLSNSRGVGMKGPNNGVVFLVAPAERKIHIAAGNGLAAQFSDSTARRIVDESVAPEFRKNRMNDGIFAGAHSIMQTLDAARVRPEGILGATELKFPEFGMLMLAISGMFLALIISWLSVRSV